MWDDVRLVNRYRLDERLGEGAMGEVWQAFDLRLDRKVAVKLLLDQLSGEKRKVERFLAEAKIGAAMQHPGIVVVFDFGEHEGRLFFVMELLAGEDLAKVLSRSRNGLPIEKIVRMGERLADALAAAHARGVVHRDIKPANIMILSDGQPKICDFGIARMVQSFGGKGTAGIGTAAYMAPEQYNGEMDARSDLYSLGCVLYEMLTGDRPFLGSPLQLLYQHSMVTPQPPSATRDEIPADLEELILQLLEKKPEDRPQTAGEVVARLEAIRTGMDRNPKTPNPIKKRPVTQLPPNELLKSGAPEQKYTDADDAMSKAIDDVLRKAHVDARVTGFTRGPSTSRFEIRLGPTTPQEAVFSLSSTLVAAVGNAAIRLVPLKRSTSPLPGVAAIGLEVPHRRPDLISLGDILREVSEDSGLTAGLGRAQDRTPVMLDLVKSPHLLVGGDSEGIDPLRNIIASMAMRQKPSRLRLVLIDSRKQRLAAFGHLPHMVDQAKDDPLGWAIAEVGRRYADLAATHCRTTEQFNREVREGRVPTPIALGDTELAHPDVLVVIDELAEAIRQAPGEEAIRELTREGRAVGVHVVARTASPNERVITSRIKGYIQARLALSVSTVEESMRVLDREGAESLCAGDGLFVGDRQRVPHWIRLAAISDDEIAAIVSHWRG
ncbi:DNA translocase FtsK [Sphaerimonospora mesophila]|uniref:DNA translocase FtsK n=1 Tax=Sphaerimonospora mesophila TaxID=37483 RepID=UPI0006E23228